MNNMYKYVFTLHKLSFEKNMATASKQISINIIFSKRSDIAL